MAQLSFLHLSGPRRGESDELRLPAMIGSEAGLEVTVAGVAPRHALIFERDGEVVLQDGGSDLGTFLAGEPVQEAVLHDGDVLELGPDGPKLRFRHEGEERVPLLRALLWARPEGAIQLSDTTGFLRAVVRETAVRTSRAFRFTAIGVVVAGGLFLGWTQWQAHRLGADVARLREAVRRAEAAQRDFHERVEQERRRSEAERQALQARIEEARQREDELKRQLGEASPGQAPSVRDELAEARERLVSLESERTAGERVIREYGPGVCLVQGAYAFYDANARPLRYKLDGDGRPLRDNEGCYALDPAGPGPMHTVEYLGTGFLVDRRGLVLTNRHVAEPWWNDSCAEAAMNTGFKPRFTLFRAFFPREPEALELDVDRLSETVDLALVRVNLKGRKVPVIPLDRSGKGAVAGQPVVVVGYPAGLEAILAKADSVEVKDILAAGTSSERVTEALARKGLIRPSTTQGHIGDITKTDIVFDAPTTQGGSGGPVLNKSGEVIAVEYAVLTKFGGNSFGVPIGYSLELLRPQKGKAGGR